MSGPEPRRVLSFTGTLGAFLDYLDSWDTAGQMDRATAAGESYDWELTASIARHPAGKGLQAGDPSRAENAWVQPCRVIVPDHVPDDSGEGNRPTEVCACNHEAMFHKDKRGDWMACWVPGCGCLAYWGGQRSGKGDKPAEVCEHGFGPGDHHYESGWCHDSPAKFRPPLRGEGDRPAADHIGIFDGPPLRPAVRRCSCATPGNCDGCHCWRDDRP